MTPFTGAALDLQQGELKQLDYQRRAYARFEGFTKDRKFMDYLAGKGKQKPIEITGMNERGEQVTCRITPDMRVALHTCTARITRTCGTFSGAALRFRTTRPMSRGGIRTLMTRGTRDPAGAGGKPSGPLARR